jgi:hypothetical protein
MSCIRQLRVARAWDPDHAERKREATGGARQAHEYRRAPGCRILMRRFAPLVPAILALGMQAALAAGPRTWVAGPHLLLDRSLVAGTEGLSRFVQSPSRLPDPVVTAFEDGNQQPYVSVVRDPATRRFRMWYNVMRPRGRGVAFMESEDGIHWLRPARVLKEPDAIGVGVSVLDEGPQFQDPTRRFKLGWWEQGGLRVGVSPDGLTWTPLTREPVVAANHDIVGLYWDPLRRRYLAALSVVSGTGPWKGLRIPHQSVSLDLVDWKQPWPIITPDPHAEIERGETQFYGLGGVVARGNLLVAMVKVLRDDLNCEPGRTAAELHDAKRPFAGIGYTVVAWSQDGERWERETQPFLERNPQSGTWDRAMSWIDAQLLVGDYTCFYYGGYRWGHKAEVLTERHLGFAHLPRDRYAGYRAEQAEGRLRTRLAQMGEAIQMTVNAALETEGGELRGRVLDERGAAWPGFDWKDCRAVKGNRVAHPVAWAGANRTLRGKTVCFEFQFKRGALFSFDLSP